MPDTSPDAHITFVHRNTLFALANPPETAVSLNEVNPNDIEQQQASSNPFQAKLQQAFHQPDSVSPELGGFVQAIKEQDSASLPGFLDTCATENNKGLEKAVKLLDASQAFEDINTPPHKKMRLFKQHKQRKSIILKQKIRL